MKLKRFIAGVLSAAMLLSVGSTLAFADNSVTVVGNTMTFKSVLYLSNEAISAPNVTYEYSLANGGSAVYADSEGSTLNIMAGEDATGATITGTSDGTVAFTSADTLVENYDTSTDPDTLLNKTVTKTVTIDFSAVTFSTTGIYHYILTEAANTTTGLTNENNLERHIYVTVVSDSDGTGTVIDEIIMSKGALTDEDDLGTAYYKSEGYTHSFGIASTEKTGDDLTTDDGDDNIATDEEDGYTEPGTDGSKSQDFIITTEAKGTMANVKKAFSFATITADLGDTYANMSFTVEGVYSDDTLATEETKITADEDGKISGTFYMSEQKSGTISILSVIQGMVFTVTISDPATATEGYSFYARDYDADYEATAETEDDDLHAWYALVSGATYENVVDSTYTTNEGINFATVKGEEETTNDVDDDPDDKDIVYSAGFPDTGVVLDLAPYAIMMMLAVGAIGFRFARVARNTEE